MGRDHDDEFDWGRYIKECLDSTLVGVLATSGNSGPWVTPIYFSYDERLNFYFVSALGTKHMLNIERDDRVALAVVNTSAITGIHQIGMQIYGKASEVPDRDIEKVYETRSRRMAFDQNWVPLPDGGHYIKEHGGTFMKITPKAISYFDSRFFGGNSQSVPLSKVTDGKKFILF